MRDWYLSTMGIVPYRLRGKPIAKGLSETGQQIPSSDLGRMQGEAQAKVVPGTDQLARAAYGKAGGIPKSLRQLVTEPTSGTEASGASVSTPLPESLLPLVADTTTGSSVTSDQTVTFRLACWRPSTDLLVIDVWPEGEDSDNRRSQLLGNMLKAVKRKPITLMQPEFFDWPFSNDLSLSGAQESLAMFVQGRYDQQPFEWLLAMGEDIRAYLKLVLKNPEQGDARMPLDCGAEVIFTHSLSEMIATPSCKKDVWATIRFLCL